MSAVARLPEQVRTARALAWAGIVLAVVVVLVTIPPLLVETHVLPALLALVALALGAFALTRGERQLGGSAIVLSVFAAAVALVVQGASSETVAGVVTAGLFAGMLSYATPLGFAALGGLYSERSGVVNIGLEGMMLMGCFWGIWACDKTDSWVLGVVGGGIAGGLLALVHAFFSIHLRADQIVSGTAINIIALGLTAYAFRSIYGTEGTPDVPRIPDVSVPIIRDIPYVGDVIGDMNVMIWLMLVLVVLSWIFLFKTPWGLRLRAVGEHPRAADTVGVRVYTVRYLAVMVSGFLAGLGGAYLSFGLLGAFSENMTAGRGFIALAALIFGKWNPYGLLAAALLFGFAQSLGDGLQTSAGVSADLVRMLPYAFTLLALVGLVGRSIPPASVGIPYRRQ